MLSIIVIGTNYLTNFKRKKNYRLSGLFSLDVIQKLSSNRSDSQQSAIEVNCFQDSFPHLSSLPVNAIALSASKENSFFYFRRKRKRKENFQKAICFQSVFSQICQLIFIFIFNVIDLGQVLLYLILASKCGLLIV